MLKGNLVIGLVLLCFASVCGQNYSVREEAWVSSTLSNMSTDQKIGQLFIIRAFSRGDKLEEQVISKYIDDYHLGGLCFFQGTPLNQISAINMYQSRSPIPMFMGMDAEYGIGMRFPKDAMTFPKQTTLGAIEDLDLIYEMGREIGRHCRAVGINVNFAPVVDVNNNANNPIIYDRSFGDSPTNTATKAISYIRGLEEEGVMAVIKHFPGHGDTSTDSHDDLPRINHPITRLNEVELLPFRTLAVQGVNAIMMGHLNVAALDSQPNIPSSMSPRIINDLLRSDLSYNGLIVTDGLDMKAITKYYGIDGRAEAEAFLAGNDILLLPENLPKAFSMVKQYVDNGTISLDRLNESVSRILKAKYKIGLSNNVVIPQDGVTNFIHRNEGYALKQKLYEGALTLVSDNESIIPIVNTAARSIGTLSVNVHTISMFQKRISDFISAKHYQWMPTNKPGMYSQMLQTMGQFETVIVAIHTSGKKNDFSKDLNTETVRFLTDLNSRTKLIVVVFGHPYILGRIPEQDNVICAYENNELAQDAAAQGLFGVFDIKGTLPVTATNRWKTGTGLSRKSLNRLGFAIPEQVGMSTAKLQELDAIAKDMIAQNATPGGQIFVARNGRVVYNKPFGLQSTAGRTVQNSTIYDVASITKILATTVTSMQLVDRGKLDINEALGTYICNIDTTNKANLIVEDVMAHVSRLPGGIVSYQSTVLPKSQTYDNRYYRNSRQEDFIVPVANNMFMKASYKDTLWKTILDVPLRSSDSYRYSDVGFMLMQRTIEEITGHSISEYASDNFYKPMGLRNTSYLPLSSHPKEFIAPTEVDNYWRMQTVQGHVHDMTTAMMGGIGGHAGLFSTAYEVGIMMQMFLNKGSYGGIQYIRPETIKKFTTRHRKSSRRGLGFDMKELDTGRTQNMSALASANTFGHMGFTGGAAFADPDEGISFIILTNRTFPSQRSQTYNNRDYRIQLHNKVYDAILK